MNFQNRQSHQNSIVPKKTRRICVPESSLCFSAVRLSLYLRLSERLDCGVQSHCLGAQMHTQCCVLCSLNSVNPSAVPKLRTQASPVFSPLSRIFTLSHRASSQHKFHWKPSSSSFSLSVLSCWLLLSLTKPSWKCFFSRWEEKKNFFGHREMFWDLPKQRETLYWRPFYYIWT